MVAMAAPLWPHAKRPALVLSIYGINLRGPLPQPPCPPVTATTPAKTDDMGRELAELRAAVKTLQLKVSELETRNAVAQRLAKTGRSIIPINRTGAGSDNVMVLKILRQRVDRVWAGHLARDPLEIIKAPPTPSTGR